ncbi:MAG: hypothetical protein COW88_00435 [Candidatus Lloydbacteria bacterium CG22_combo_CG10-13_8_21_14_all_47_15]|uniref:Uncharacterized protein n=1 Tax=Candidatus Lloydbacteria bacterium CG22_combo_CG10-13_8_21_14_all_47_15 TaxID=1974635 RepID=A0A2H0CVY6_9BACT|nr:MAG: hypothetical protein COW88_00435 [Candidatus Lloydbacteria bacterium CG22_combo_CG10-13_8_21_14_all_47_15]
MDDIENKYKEYSTENVCAYKSKWDKDYFRSVDFIDVGEILFIGLGTFTFLCLSWGFKVVFIVTLVLFYWFRIKWTEKKIVEAKQYLILGSKFLDENFRGRGVTVGGAEPHYNGHKRGFEDFINFLETQRNHLVARMVILNLFALVLLEIIRIR